MEEVIKYEKKRLRIIEKINQIKQEADNQGEFELKEELFKILDDLLSKL